MSALIFENIRILSPGSALNGANRIGIDQGVFVDPDSLPEAPRIDGGNQLLIPGLIDLRTHLREPDSNTKAVLPLKREPQSPAASPRWYRHPTQIPSLTHLLTCDLCLSVRSIAACVVSSPRRY